MESYLRNRERHGACQNETYRIKLYIGRDYKITKNINKGGIHITQKRFEANRMNNIRRKDVSQGGNQFSTYNKM